MKEVGRHQSDSPQARFKDLRSEEQVEKKDESEGPSPTNRRRTIIELGFNEFHASSQGANESDHNNNQIDVKTEQAKDHKKFELNDCY